MGKWIFKYEFPYKILRMVPKFYIIDGVRLMNPYNL